MEAILKLSVDDIDKPDVILILKDNILEDIKKKKKRLNLITKSQSTGPTTRSLYTQLLVHLGSQVPRTPIEVYVPKPT